MLHLLDAARLPRAGFKALSPHSLQNRLQAMQIVVSLVEPNSNDAKRAQQELEQLKKLAGETTTQAGKPETLTEPQTPKKQINPQIELPKEAAPPASGSAGTKVEASPLPLP